METKIVYTSFDRFPSPKGAATHIGAFLDALGRNFPNVDLVTIPPAPITSLKSREETTEESHKWCQPGVTHHPIPAEGDHLFERVHHYRSRIWQWWQNRFAGSKVPVVHFRSIFEGYPLALHKSECCDKMVYEVNGLPSIELKYHYPKVAEDVELLRKLQVQEDVCLAAADVVLTVSDVNREYLVKRNVAEEKIRVIRNGVDLGTFQYSKPCLDPDRPLELIYTGTLTSWQGVGHAIEALRLYRRDAPARLRIVGPVRNHERKRLERLIWKSELTDYVSIEGPSSKMELSRAYHSADVALAPLTQNDRNTKQGCCPLKVIEAMATGIPLVASRLAVVQELALDNHEALLVRPGSPKAIKDALFRLRDEPDLATRLSSNGRSRVEREFQWERAQSELVEVYKELIG